MPYSAHFSLNRIMPGVDNFRYDVHLSPVFRESVSKIIFHLIIKVAKADADLDVEFNWIKEKDEFKRICRDIMLGAVKRAKMGDGEVQIDYLAQIAVCKFIIQEINSQFDELLTRLNNQVWEYESAGDDDMVVQTLSLKERVMEIRHKRNMIISVASREIFQLLLEAQKPLKERREANYGRQSLLKDDIFTNPILHIDNQPDDYFMLENYVLLGNRIDDPDKYSTLLSLISALLGKLNIDRSCLVMVNDYDENVYKSARNIPKISVRPLAELNAGDICNHRKLLFTKEAFVSLLNKDEQTEN